MTNAIAAGEGARRRKGPSGSGTGARLALPGGFRFGSSSLSPARCFSPRRELLFGERPGSQGIHPRSGRILFRGITTAGRSAALRRRSTTSVAASPTSVACESGRRRRREKRREEEEEEEVGVGRPPFSPNDGGGRTVLLV